MRDKSLPCSGQRSNKPEGKELSNPTEQVTSGGVVSQASRQGELEQHCGNVHCLGQQLNDGVLPGAGQQDVPRGGGDSWCE